MYWGLSLSRPGKGSFPVGVRRRRVGHDGHDNDTQHSDHQPERPPRMEKSRIGLIVAGSMAAGLVLAVVLVALPFIPGRENVLTGVVLLAFALGWALLAALSVRLTDQPQRDPMPGQLVDVGGHRLHLYWTGSGSPTVVLEPGLRGGSSDLGWVAPGRGPGQ